MKAEKLDSMKILGNKYCVENKVELITNIYFNRKTGEKRTQTTSGEITGFEDSDMGNSIFIDNKRYYLQDFIGIKILK